MLHRRTRVHRLRRAHAATLAQQLDDRDMAVLCCQSQRLIDVVRAIIKGAEASTQLLHDGGVTVCCSSRQGTCERTVCGEKQTQTARLATHIVPEQHGNMFAAGDETECRFFVESGVLLEKTAYS